MDHRTADPSFFLDPVDVPPDPGRRRPGLVPVVIAALLLVGAVGCNGDDGDAASGTTTSELNGSSEDPSEETASTSDPGSGRPYNESRLVDALLDPSEVGEGLERDPAAGAGGFVPQVCPGVAVDVFWQDQAGQSLRRARDEGQAPVVTQSILEFANTEGSWAFIEDTIAATMTCNPGIEPALVDGPGDRTFTFETEGSGGAALIRSGPYVTYLVAHGDPSADGAPVLTAQVLETAVDRLPS